MNEKECYETQLITESKFFQFVFSFFSCLLSFRFRIFSSIPVLPRTNHVIVQMNVNNNNKWFGIKGCYLIQWRNDSTALAELNTQIILCGLALLLLPLFFISAIFKVRNLNLFLTCTRTSFPLFTVRILFAQSAQK